MICFSTYYSPAEKITHYAFIERTHEARILSAQSVLDIDLCGSLDEGGHLETVIDHLIETARSAVAHTEAKEDFEKEAKKAKQILRLPVARRK